MKQWLKDLSKEVRFAIGADIRYLQEHWPEANQMPRVRALGAGLYEARTKVDRNQYRILFCILDSTMMILHGFLKKTRAIPQDELILTRQRQQNVIYRKKEKAS